MKKTRKLTLTSRWFNHRLTLRVPAKVAEMLDNGDGMKMVRMDLDRRHYGVAPKMLTPYQCDRVLHYFGDDDMNYFDKIEIN